MKTFTRMLAVAAVAAFTALPAYAQNTGTKIATVRIGDIANQAPQFKAVNEKLKAEFERRQNEFEADMKKFQEDGNSFKKEADILAAADRAKKEKDLLTRQVDLQSKGRTLQEEFQRRQQQLINEAEGKLKSVIEQVAKEKGVAVVIVNPAYASPEADLTAEVLKRLQAPGK